MNCWLLDVLVRILLILVHILFETNSRGWRTVGGVLGLKVRLSWFFFLFNLFYDLWLILGPFFFCIQQCRNFNGSVILPYSSKCEDHHGIAISEKFLYCLSEIIQNSYYAILKKTGMLQNASTPQNQTPKIKKKFASRI